MADYSVSLVSASFNAPDSSGFTSGNFAFALFIDDEPQATIELMSRIQGVSPSQLFQAAQTDMAKALKGWLESISTIK